MKRKLTAKCPVGAMASFGFAVTADAAGGYDSRENHCAVNVK